jgi:uncharacterized protein (TIGR00725 family)
MPPSASPNRIIAVFGSAQSVPGDGVYEDGVRCGELLAAAKFTVATGGYAGLMEAVSRGARAGGGIVIGVTAPTVFPDRSGANAYVDREHPAPSLLDRIHTLTSQSDAAITLPGSLGTLTELVAAWNLAFVARFSNTPPKPIVTVGSEWATLVDHLAQALNADRRLVTTVDTVEAAVVKVTELLG